MRIRFISLLVVIGCAFSNPGFARNYAVELIIFERGGDPASQEQWDPASNQVALNQEQLFAMSREASSQPLQNGSSRLSRIEGELVSSGYRVLRSLRWQQRGTVFPNAPVINVGIPGGALEGFIRIYKTSLIFADINLGLAEDGVGQPLFFINEKRRLKFKEIHYFDHPRMGAILGVWPA